MEKDLVARLEAAVARLEALGVAGGSAASRDLALDASPAAADQAIEAFDELVEKSLGRVTKAAYKIEGKVLEVTKVLAEAFAALKELLVEAKRRQKPDIAGLAEFLKPLNEVVVKANKLTEGKRTEYFNHLKAAADSLTALAWVAYLGKDCGMSMPIAHVEESWQMAEFYNNKVLVEYRNKNADHVEWAKSLKELYLPGLREFVKSFYPLGLSWGSASGANVPPSSITTQPKAPATKASAPAPPPPPPPSAPLFTSEAAPSQPKVGMSAVFQEISSNKSVTSGLKKVTDDMKAKNQADRTGVVSAPDKASRSTSFAFNREGPPKLELQMGRKWAVENQIGKKNLVIDDCDSKQSVYVFGCKDTVLQIKGKVNNITVDKCTKMGIVFMDVVAACEIVNCNGVEVQCQGSAPTISIDNTSGCQLYLSKDSLGASITTAKSSEINVLVPGGSPDSDWVEHALPQQFVHTFKDGHFTTSPVSHSESSQRRLVRSSCCCQLFYLPPFATFSGVPYGKQSSRDEDTAILRSSVFDLFHGHEEEDAAASSPPRHPCSPTTSLVFSKRRHPLLLAILVALLQALSLANAQSFIGVNYGQVADNLPPPSVTASLLQSTTISKLRLYGADPAVLRSFAGTNVSLVVGVPNSDVASLASDPSAGVNWASANLLPFLPATTISVVSVGNEALNSGDASLAPLLLPAMKNLRTALAASPAAAGIKVSTVHSMAVMSASAPPSAGAFDSGLSATLTGILGFLSDTGSPFMINPYPFFAYRDDPRPETLAFCLFQPNPGRFDAGSGINYTNMFDAQVDAIRSALDRIGFKDVEIVVAETGWPYKGDPSEVGTTVENAQAFIGGLVSHLRSMVGTPKMPGRSVDTYIFALYDEDLKPGPTSERSFGIYRADGTANYDAGLTESASSPSPTQGSTVAPVTASSPPPTTITPPASTTSPPAPTLWCAPGEVLQAGNDGRRCYVPGGVGSVGARTTELWLSPYVVLAMLLLSYVI